MLVDCPPSLNLLTVNAMAAANAILVPLQCEFFALEGLSQLLKTVEQVKSTLNPQLTIHGIVLTMYDARNNLSNQVVADVRENSGEKVYDTIIPRNVRVSEAPSYGKPVLVYDLKCVGSEAYLRLATEIIQREKELLAGAARPGGGSGPDQQPGAATDGGGGAVTSSGEASMADDGRSRLGRGLAALIGDVGAEATTSDRARTQRRVPIEFLKPNPRNPRRNFSDAELDELAASIRERGIVQPIVVRPARGYADTFEIIAGERRWRAAQRAGLHQVPIVVLDVNDDEALELAIIENVQRADLNPLEEATGYQALVNEFRHSQEDIAKIVGKSRSHVANTLRLLKLPEPVKAYINAGKISAGAARMLIGQDDPEEMAREIVERGLNVRQVEALAKERTQGPGRAGKKRTGKQADTVALEKRLSDALGLDVTIEHRGKAGVVSVRYRTLEQLDEVVRRLGRH